MKMKGSNKGSLNSGKKSVGKQQIITGRGYKHGSASSSPRNDGSKKMSGPNITGKA